MLARQQFARLHVSLGVMSPYGNHIADLTLNYNANRQCTYHSSTTNQSNATCNNGTESVRKISIRFSLVVHTYSVLSLFVHYDRIRSRFELRAVTTVSLYLVHLKGYNLNQSILHNEKCKYLLK